MKARLTMRAVLALGLAPVARNIARARRWSRALLDRAGHEAGRGGAGQRAHRGRPARPLRLGVVMPTTLPARPACERSLSWRETGRVLRLSWRARRLARRMAVESRQVDQLGIDAAGDGLLRAARAWVACHAEIAALLGQPEPPEVGQVRAAGKIRPRG